MQSVCIPFPASPSSFSIQNFRANLLVRAFTADELEAGRQTRADKLAKWAALNLRQDFADETFMRNQIKAAGLHSPNRMEPATVSRLRTMLTLAKVTGPEINASVSTNLDGFLALNPLLPL